MHDPRKNFSSTIGEHRLDYKHSVPVEQTAGGTQAAGLLLTLTVRRMLAGRRPAYLIKVRIP